MMKLDEDTEILEFLDFSVETPCESPEDCPKPIEWRMVKACCGKVQLRCTSHKDEVLAGYINCFILGGGKVLCTACRSVISHPTGYASVEPV